MLYHKKGGNGSSFLEEGELLYNSWRPQPIDDDINSVDDSILMDVIFLGFEGLDCLFQSLKIGLKTLNSMKDPSKSSLASFLFMFCMLSFVIPFFFEVSFLMHDVHLLLHLVARLLLWTTLLLCTYLARSSKVCHNQDSSRISRTCPKAPLVQACLMLLHAMTKLLPD